MPKSIAFLRGSLESSVSSLDAKRKSLLQIIEALAARVIMTLYNS